MSNPRMLAPADFTSVRPKGPQAIDRSSDRRRHGAELLKQAEHVEFDPLFRQLPAGHAINLGARERHLLASRRYVEELAGVRATPGLAHRYSVTFGQQIFDGGGQVRKGVEEGRRELPEPVDPVNRRLSWKMSNEVARQDVISHAEVLWIDTELILAPDQGLVFLDRHEVPPFLLTSQAASWAQDQWIARAG